MASGYQVLASCYANPHIACIPPQHAQSCFCLAGNLFAISLLKIAGPQVEEAECAASAAHGVELAAELRARHQLAALRMHRGDEYEDVKRPPAAYDNRAQ